MTQKGDVFEHPLFFRLSLYVYPVIILGALTALETRIYDESTCQPYPPLRIPSQNKKLQKIKC